MMTANIRVSMQECFQYSRVLFPPLCGALMIKSIDLDGEWSRLHMAKSSLYLLEQQIELCRKGTEKLGWNCKRQIFVCIQLVRLLFMSHHLKSSSISCVSCRKIIWPQTTVTPMMLRALCSKQTALWWTELARRGTATIAPCVVVYWLHWWVWYVPCKAECVSASWCSIRWQHSLICQCPLYCLWSATRLCSEDMFLWCRMRKS